jgi:ABC-type phosphate/phosphonate transport system substrate-binding protein
MIASLNMYDLPELRPATDAWWRGVARALRGAGIEDVPATLTRDADYDPLRCPDLLLAQTCGYPLTHELAGAVELIATPAYSANGCIGADYCSLVVIADDNTAGALDDLRGSVCAYNARNSQSGYNVLRSAVAPLARGGTFFSRLVESGGHAASLEMVAAGEADLCAVDCVSHALIARCRPDALAGTRVLAATEKAPCLPYVTRAGVDSDFVRRLRDGLDEAFADPRLADARGALLLAGAHVLDDAAYQCIVDMETAARVAGYAELG